MVSNFIRYKINLSHENTKEIPQNLQKREIFLIFAADLKHKKMGIYKYQAEIDALIQQGLKMPEVVCDLSKTFKLEEGKL